MEKKNEAFTVVKFKDIESVVGQYAVLNRVEKKEHVPGKLISVDVEKHRLVWEILDGPDNGVKISCSFLEGLFASFYEEENKSAVWEQVEEIKSHPERYRSV
jgi:hypothetical protein